MECMVVLASSVRQHVLLSRAGSDFAACPMAAADLNRRRKCIIVPFDRVLTSFGGGGLDIYVDVLGEATSGMRSTGTNIVWIASLLCWI